MWSRPGRFPLCRPARSRYELLMCNTYGDTVTRHVLDRSAELCHRQRAASSSEVARSAGWRVCQPPTSVWIAVSNHNANNIMMYEHSDVLERGFETPMAYCDGAPILMACASARTADISLSPMPVRRSCTSIRTDGQGGTGYTDARRIDSGHGASRPSVPAGTIRRRVAGPKGIDLDKSMTVLATTCEYQPLLSWMRPSMLASVLPTALAGLGSGV